LREEGEVNAKQLLCILTDKRQALRFDKHRPNTQ
jgi:hypothetical protein